MSRLVIPLPMVVITHNVYKVEVLVHLFDIVGHVNGVSCSPDGSSQDKVDLVKSFSQLANQGDVVHLVLGFALPSTCNKTF